MLNPIGKSDSRLAVQRYRVEPYVMPADIYGESPHTGKGGWTWYTGAAGWYWRIGIEELLGVRVRNGVLHIAPVVPPGWPGFSVTLRRGRTVYDIEVGNPSKAQGRWSLQHDGQPVSPEGGVPFIDDGARHRVVATLA
jgi:cyclic beta-1,2-glucan synthetase